MELRCSCCRVLSPSACLPPSPSPCLETLFPAASLRLPAIARSPPAARRERSRFRILARGAKQSDSKSAPLPPRPELWELREYEDLEEEGGGEKKKKGKTRRTFETEAEARRHHWISRMWAPWEEALSPEARFAVDALNLNQGEEPVVPREMMENLNVNKPIIPDDAEVLEDLDDIEAKEHGALPGTVWKEPMVYSLIPPRDWPPSGWRVDPDELAFIRSIHGIMDSIVGPLDLSTAVPAEDNPASHPRWEMFLKQYGEWAAANKERLDRETEEWKDEYYPGRRKMGDEYIEGMYELPFIYPGQHYIGQVTMVHLYEGAFVNIGAVHDGWVPIKRNDWYWIRKIIKVGMRCQVEVIAKRDPYRFRFPIELRFVQPNIDHLIFNRFDYPPVFVRPTEQQNMDLVNREACRPLWPRRRPLPDEEDEPEDSEKPPKYNHPYSFKVWQLHVAEEAALDDEEQRAAGIVKPPQKLNEITTERSYEDADSFWTEERVGGENLLSLVMIQHEWELDLDSARKEREAVDKARDEAEEKGELFEEPKLQRIKYMEELDIMNWQRYLDHHEAVQRDRINRLELGLPLEEPGKYADDSFFGENKYNPREKRWRKDYLGDYSKFKDEGKQQRGPSPPASEIKQRNDTQNTILSSRKGSNKVGLSGMDKDDTSFKQNGEATENGEKVVNGTVSSRVSDMNGCPRSIESSEDETE